MKTNFGGVGVALVTPFSNEGAVKYEDIPNLCEKYKIKKNLINPDYSG